ncbi:MULTISPECIES: hypothetical protein [unclassified Salinibacterium]|uniref:hypothetical protein n=1 Tax=unclassified Salinibacterium TaxID=2632331 RepID=UPI001420F8CF|nr:MULTISPECIES: hypothetical protein [unclassified Salinibacterium]
MTDHISTTPAAAPAPEAVLAAPTKTTNGWGIGGLVLGIVSMLLAFIPFFGFVALVPAPFGIISSIVGLVVKNKKRGLAITGLILSILAIIIGLVMSLGLMIALSGGGIDGFFEVGPASTIEVSES